MISLIILGIVIFAIENHLKPRLKNRGIEYNELGRWDKSRKYRKLWQKKSGMKPHRKV